MPVPKILIVDDTPLNVMLLERVLQGQGFRTIAASSGALARELTRTEAPDLILLDVMMPGEDGFETCEAIKSDPATTNIPIIFLSALDDVKSKVRGLQAGGVDYVAKPMHAEEVLARVRAHLRTGEHNRALAGEQKLRMEQLRHAQQAILVQPADCPEAAFAVYYKPLEETGGDFYDVYALADDLFGYFVADVSGHGASAAFLTSAVKALLRQHSSPLFSSEDTLRGVDSVMRQILKDEQYLTACYARLNRRTHKLSVVSAGHPPVIVVRASGEWQTLEMDSEPLGLFSALVIQRKDIRVFPGDRFFLYTDGLIESSGDGRSEGLKRLVAACVAHRTDSLHNDAMRIVLDIREGATSIQDDLLLLAAEVAG